MGYSMRSHYMYTRYNDQIGVTGTSVTSDILNFFVLGTFRIMLAIFINCCQLPLFYYTVEHWKFQSRRCYSVLEHLPSMYKALGLILSTTKKLK
jgi:hypothetical protein